MDLQTRKTALSKSINILALAALAGLLAFSPASARDETVECTVILDAATDKPVYREGTCDQRFTPMSSFKLPLALMGYDSGVLADEHAPLWPYKAEFKGRKREQKSVDPTIWEADSIVWYSQEITRRLGEGKFADYVSKFDYGNKDVSGAPGKQGLTHAWLMTSLKISPDEQAKFVSRMLAGKLPVSAKALEMTQKIIPMFQSGDGWVVHGKTGSGWMRNSKGEIDRNRPIGWFVGWAEKDGRQLVFARMKISPKAVKSPFGPMLRAAFVKDLPGLIKGN
jgi:beta-lactamase class D